ncbi:mechanosensitive ion channel [Luteolibacter sp. SL250]|uniref:mechanosensitive ion channel family protein n=1 Tax=Luteolibacter sp. SL250 TaxID=2995170 RepID=UPI00226ED967|nr:mechanosensitive ion channel domain-containing protein [Luteolibacter sp. SL250]WAC18311.1 mechanosensitive ion channel [Luteolibacter sp. SL250]
MILAQTVTVDGAVPTEPLSWTEQATRYGQKSLDTVVAFAPKVGLTLLMALVGWKLAKLLSGWLQKLLENKRIDPSLRPFLGSLLDAAFKVALVITLINYLGIPTASFVAVIGAAGLAVGLALSGTLQNFAGGVVLLIIRPFRVGDMIKAQTFEGIVTEIQIFQTVLRTPDNLTVFIPNGKLVNESIMNFSIAGTRRVDLTFGIGYEDSIDHARDVVMRLVAEDTRIHESPAPVVIVQNLGDSTVDIQARFWVASGDHFRVSCEMRERVKKTFDKEKISFPFPQVDYHMIGQAPKPEGA